MKTYVLMISRTFPKGHKREGENTYFPEKILNGQKIEWPEDYNLNPVVEVGNKIHTIRQNYALWFKRMIEVQQGRAELSLRYWSGKPYRSKQIEFLRLGKDDGVGIEKLTFDYFRYKSVDDKLVDTIQLAKNDGLSFSEFESWFADRYIKESMAIIHFTKFRYNSQK